MTANLLLSQAAYQTQPPDIEHGMVGGSVQNRSAVSKTYDESSGDSRESFLKTFEQITKDHKPNRQTQGAGGGKPSTSPAYSSDDKLQAASCPAMGLETGISETTDQLEEDLDNAERQINPAWDLSAVISVLEKLGLYDSAGGSSSANKMDEILGNTEGLAALKMRIARLGQNDAVPSVEMKAVLDRLQQFIANAHTSSAPSHSNGNLLGELTDSRSIEPADLNQSAENSQTDSRSESREKTDAIKLAMAAPRVEVEAGKNAREPRSFETVRTDSSRLKDGPDTPGKTGTSSQANLLNRISSTIDSGKQFGGESAQQNLQNTDASSIAKITQNAPAEKAINQGQRYVGETVQDNTVNNESSPVSKMIHDSQLAKENHIRMTATMSDESGGKIPKADAAANDNGLLSSQNHTAEKAFEVASQSKQTDTGQDSLRTQTLDQIVRKAVVYMRNGQHEAKIELKPEFLGHVRMQVTTENHQVTVKILTEFGFVKDMVENNIHQLKADLQQQGLNVDKLEVAVSDGSNEFKHPQNKAGQAKDRQRSTARITPGNREGKTRAQQTENSGLRKADATTVDYYA